MILKNNFYKCSKNIVRTTLHIFCILKWPLTVMILISYIIDVIWFFNSISKSIISNIRVRLSVDTFLIFYSTWQSSAIVYLQVSVYYSFIFIQHTLEIDNLSYETTVGFLHKYTGSFNTSNPLKQIPIRKTISLYYLPGKIDDSSPVSIDFNTWESIFPTAPSRKNKPRYPWLHIILFRFSIRHERCYPLTQLKKKKKVYRFSRLKGSFDGKWMCTYRACELTLKKLVFASLRITRLRFILI